MHTYQPIVIEVGSCMTKTNKNCEFVKVLSFMIYGHLL